MIQAGGIISTPGGKGLSQVLSTRELPRGDGSTDISYTARTLNGDAPASSRTNPLSNSTGLQAPDGVGGSVRLVDPSTLTVAQAQAAGVSPQDLQRVEEANGVDGSGRESDQDGPTAAGQTDQAGNQLNPEEQAQVAQLRARDAAVRQEEQAHAATAGGYASAPQYQTVTGPDGNQYAVSGHVDVKANVSGSPEQVEQALKTIQAAALAPNAPSSADLSAFRGAVADQGAVRAQAAGAANAPDQQSENAPFATENANPALFAAANDAYRRAIGA